MGSNRSALSASTCFKQKGHHHYTFYNLVYTPTNVIFRILESGSSQIGDAACYELGLATVFLTVSEL